MRTVIGHRASRAFRVLWMLEELGEVYEHLPAQPHSPEVVAWNPAGKIPVLRDDDVAISDSTAILQYLSDRSGRFTFGSGTRDRARQDSWTNMLLDELDACVWTAAKHSFILPKDLRVPDVKRALRWEFERSTRRIGSIIEGSAFLMGDAMTVPDFILTHCLSWARLAKFPHDSHVLEEYLERMQARPAYRRVESK